VTAGSLRYAYVVKRAVALALVLPAAVAAGCGGSSSPVSTGYVHPLGAYVAPECSILAENRGPQYVAVTSWAAGRLAGDSGRFVVPKCANVIVYLDSDKPDELRVPSLRISTKVARGKTAKLEFYAPPGAHAVRLHRNEVEVLRVVVSD
jgi:hypothetical protein